MSLRLTGLRTLAGLAALLAASAGPADARTPPPLPDWAIEGSYVEALDPGFVSLEGTYDFPIGDETASLSLTYDKNARLDGGGGLGFSFYSVSGTTGPSEAGQVVTLTDIPKNPGF